MNVRTTEDSFEYQVNRIFKRMKRMYNEDQEERRARGEYIETFADWLWNHSTEFGINVYNAYDEYAGIDETTEHLNIK